MTSLPTVGAILRVS